MCACLGTLMFGICLASGTDDDLVINGTENNLATSLSLIITNFATPFPVVIISLLTTGRTGI